LTIANHPIERENVTPSAQASGMDKQLPSGALDAMAVVALTERIRPVRLDLNRIRSAVSCIAPVFRNTPRYVCPPLGEALDCELILKLETANPIRRFKGRGTETAMARLADGSGGQRRLRVLSRLDQLVMTGPTLTNVNDFRAILVR
jgi:hypothetical protein